MLKINQTDMRLKVSVGCNPPHAIPVSARAISHFILIYNPRKFIPSHFEKNTFRHFFRVTVGMGLIHALGRAFDLD